jgi:hypothetical protein
MRYILISAAAAMALAGAATLGNAQAQDNEKNRGPAAEGKAPGSGSAERAPGGGDQTQQTAPNRTEQKSEPRKGAGRESGNDQPRAAQQPKEQPQTDKDRSKSATQPQRDNDKQKSTDQRKGDNDKQKSTDQRKGDDDKQKAADQRKGDNDKQKAADQRKGDNDKQKSAKDSNQPQAGRVQVTEEKRGGVRERLVKEQRVDRVQRSRINVSINVGARLPRSVRLHALPVTIVSFEPAYRGYSYIVLEDQTICIVDERTYVIVDVIPAGSQRADGPGRAHLILSLDDMRYIYRSVPKDRSANVRIRLALGAEVPRDVELYEFPVEIVERVPDVRRYRYIVADGEVIIVDPNDQAVALVINE